MGSLTVKQRIWVEEFLVCLNATEAARRAGYRHPNQQGPRMLVNVGILRQINRRLSEQAMSANEVLYRLTQQARANILEFFSLRDLYQVDKDGESRLVGQVLDVDLDRIFECGLGPLIHSISQTANGVKIEWYDSQAALVQLGKAHGLFRDRVEHSGEITQTQIHVYIPDNGRNDRILDE